MPKCNEIMTPDPNFCLPNTCVAEVAKLMKSKNIGPVPVIEDEDCHRLVGIVTDRDLVINALAEGRDINSTRVEQVMTPRPLTCNPDDDIVTAIEMMETNQVRRLPVVDRHGKLVGIISQGDIAIRMSKTKKAGELLQEISKPEIISRALRRRA
jgi:CBS domain-containing protein